MKQDDIPTPHLAAIAGEAPWSPDEFEARLREKGTSYHIYHPFHVMMAEGKLSQTQLQRWVANRYLYQVAIPVKDANILANCPDRDIRREWIQRILDHDGYAIG
nr:pyrroloquinoline quinone biosynthesis protein C [Denitromonas sp.]